MEVDKNWKLRAICALLKPIAKLCLRRSFLFHEFIEAAKGAYVEAAVELMRGGEAEINVSRLSVMTGIYRKDITRIYREGRLSIDQPQTLLRRVIWQWQSDRRYRVRSGEPRLLSCRGENSEFFKLVKGLTTTVSPATVLFELERSGAAKVSPEGVRLIADFAPEGTDERKGLSLLAQDVTSLIVAVEENLRSQTSVGNHHIRTEYDNVYVDALPQIRKWISDEGRVFHRRIREYLSTFDQDVSPRGADYIGTNARGRVVLTSFALAKDPETQ